jgi:tetratricopeptide (TPR) repeat protein
LVKSLVDGYGRIKDPQTQKEVKIDIDTLPWYAVYGKALEAFKAPKPNYQSILAMLKPFVDKHKAKQLPELDPQFLQEMLGMALRVYVLTGDTKSAKEILDVFLEASNFDEANQKLRGLVVQMIAQVKALKEQGDPVKAEYEATVRKYRDFLDQLAKLGDGPKSPDTLRFLATSYSGLGVHDKSAELLAKYPKPEPTGDPEVDKKNKSFYNGVQLMYVQELRLAGKYKEATETLGRILESDWGKNNLEAKKERIYLYEDQKDYFNAANQWNTLMRQLGPHIEKDAKLKEQYNECYYRLCVNVYRHGTNRKTEEQRAKTIKQAAEFIHKLELSDPTMGGLKNRYLDFLKKEPPLKEQYDLLKNASSSTQGQGK